MNSTTMSFRTVEDLHLCEHTDKILSLLISNTALPTKWIMFSYCGHAFVVLTPLLELALP